MTKIMFAVLAAFVSAASFPPLAAMAQTAPQNADSPALIEARKKVKNINTEALKALIKKNRKVLIIDVRTEREMQLTGGMIRATRNMVIPRGWLEFRIKDAAPDKNTPIVVYCGTNRRSPLAALTLERMGYKNVQNYADGFPAWKKAGLPLEIPDRAMDSFLYSKPQKVADGVWSAIGATAPSTYENAGHNNNLSFVVTNDGVLAVNAGGSWLLAAEMHREIKKITDQPVKYVVLENGQGHAALGSSYWKAQGAKIIAQKDAAEEFEERAEAILASAKQRLRDKAYRTQIALADETFEDKKIIEMGGVRIELLNLGPAHSPGDIAVWLPQKKLVISGDMAFHKRLLPVFEYTETGEWIKSWKNFENLKADIIIPGHGGPTDYKEVTKYTRDYLIDLRGKVRKLVDAGGTLQQSYKIDQSAYAHLDTFKELAGRNAGRLFEAMEFE